MKKQKILLIDANALIHRAFHALPPLTIKNGELVNAVYGFSLILLKTINELNPDYVATAFDTPQPTFRHKEFKDYKATRQKADLELISQFPKVKEVITALGIPIFEKPGFEADDIVGTLAKKAEEKNLEAIIVTGDLDEVQLVSPNIKVYTMRRGFTDTVLYDESQVKEKYEGLSPLQIADYKALRGDPSDNIPGVLGIGEKTAIELIKKFGSIENLYKEIKNNTKKVKDLKPKVLENLREKEKEAKISKYLALIVKDLPLELDLKKTETGVYDREIAINVFKKFEFRTLLAKLPKSKTLNKQKRDFDFKIIKEEKELLKVLKAIKNKTQEIVVDTETEKLDSVSGKLIGVSLSFSEKEAFYIPTENNDFLKLLKPFLEDKNIKKIGHNLKYDISVLACYGINLAPVYFDTMIAYYLLRPGERRLSLDDLAFSELGFEKISIEELIGKGKNSHSAKASRDKQKLLNEAPLEKVAEYSSEDAVITFRLFKKVKPLLQKENLEELFLKIEMPLVSILAEMERNGVKIDSLFLKKMSKRLEKEIENLKTKICRLANCDFNINSPQQLKEVLFEKLKLAESPEIKKEMKKLKSGGFSTAAGILEKLKDTHPIINLLFDYRELVKLKTTYADALPKLVHPKTGRVHTNFNQTITATGRLSSSNPNLQNIPIRTKVGREIRKAFVAEKGYKLISADYSQIELRIIAHLSGDQKMIDSFRNHEDIHTRTAADVNEIPLKDVTYEERRAAKAVNFGIVYGISAHGLAGQLGWNREEAQKYIDKYYKKHPGILKYVTEIVEVAKDFGFVETLLGRRRYLPEINSNNFQIRSAAERMAINFPAQGTAADLMKLAMIEITKIMPKLSPKSKMTLQVHDELVFEVPEKEVKQFSLAIEKIMEGIYPELKVPIRVDITYGNNWKDMAEIIKGDKRKTKGFQH